MDELQKKIAAVVQQKFQVETDIKLHRPDAAFGDFATNVALQLAGRLHKSPKEIAQALADALRTQLSGYKIETAGPGFINITLPDTYYFELLNEIRAKGDMFGGTSALNGKTVMVEGTDPNPFKELHIGHVYSNTIGEGISRLHEAAGAQVIRANYQGDVGVHVAKAVWGIQQLLDEKKCTMADIAKRERPKFLGEAYARGAKAFEEDETTAVDIRGLNKKIYQLDEDTKGVYETGRQWSLDYFETLYKRLRTHFDVYYFERQTGEEGLRIVTEHAGVFEESDGAIVYRGEKHGLHTRVFVNSQGFPTYEAKDLGLSFLKERDYAPDISITFTGNEIDEYFRVVQKALEEIRPELVGKFTHIGHGMVRLPSGKMSSRTGDVVTAKSLLDEVEEKIRIRSPESPAIIDNTLGAIKYAFLKHRIGGNIVFDMDESISLEGNTGVYLQYAHARARSVLSKVEQKASIEAQSLEADERLMLRTIGGYPDVVAKAIDQLAPHHVCTYLYELSQAFNRFYEKNRIAGDAREALRAQIVAAFAQTLKNGLLLLNIPAPERM